MWGRAADLVQCWRRQRHQCMSIVFNPLRSRECLTICFEWPKENCSPAILLGTLCVWSHRRVQIVRGVYQPAMLNVERFGFRGRAPGDWAAELQHNDAKFRRFSGFLGFSELESSGNIRNSFRREIKSVTDGVNVLRVKQP